jgi:hypothetical protein
MVISLACRELGGTEEWSTKRKGKMYNIVVARS